MEISLYPIWDLSRPFLTHLADSEGALVSCVDLTGTASRKVKQFDQTRNHLILLLCVAQTPVTAETPAEHSLLGVQHQLHKHMHGEVTSWSELLLIISGNTDLSNYLTGFMRVRSVFLLCGYPRRPHLGPPRWARAWPGHPWTSQWKWPHGEGWAHSQTRCVEHERWTSHHCCDLQGYRWRFSMIQTSESRIQNNNRGQFHHSESCFISQQSQLQLIFMFIWIRWCPLVAKL